MCREAGLGSGSVFSLTRHGLLIYEATAVVIKRLPGGCFFFCFCFFFFSGWFFYWVNTQARDI